MPYDYALAQEQAPSAAVGVHPQLSDLAKRISASVSVVEKLLNRVTGPKPTEGITGNKETREPSTQECIAMCHKEMARMENRLADLQTAIS
jgi:hypothetical protein